jgi:lipid-A-disaccharide synthase-like uncharacterized protein
MADERWWLLLGFGGQAVFMGRFLIQWLASERDRRSVIPVSFWYLSIAGALVLLVYAVHRRDPVFVAGQGLGVAIYLRNLQLIRRARDAGSAHGHGRHLGGQHERHAEDGDQRLHADRRRDADVGAGRDQGQCVDAQDEQEGRRRHGPFRAAPVTRGRTRDSDA